MDSSNFAPSTAQLLTARTCVRLWHAGTTACVTASHTKLMNAAAFVTILKVCNSSLMPQCLRVIALPLAGTPTA